MGQTAAMSFRPTNFVVEVVGAGRPVIFLSGFACSGHVWDDTVEHLGRAAESHVVTLAGVAGVPPVARPSLAGVRAEIERYIVDNALASPVIVGHSLGGMLALWLAQTVPDVGAVIDIEGLPYIGGPGEPTGSQLQSMTVRELETWLEDVMGGMFTAADDRDRVLAESAKSDVETLAQFWREGMQLDLRTDLGRIDAPVVVVVATDPAAPDEQAELWRSQIAAIRNADLKFLQGSHFVMFDQAAEFNAIADTVIGIRS